MSRKSDPKHEIKRAVTPAAADSILSAGANPSANKETDAYIHVGASRPNQRRRFLQTATAGLASISASAVVEAKTPESWHKAGAGFTNYGQPDTDNNGIIRWISANPVVPGEGVSWTPLHELEGTITPNGLHFERHHNGVPELQSDQWALSLHGQVRRALSFTRKTLHRYPMESRIGFIECGGNSNSLWHETAVQAAAGLLHGLVSCAEWTGIRLSLVLDKALKRWN